MRVLRPVFSKTGIDSDRDDGFNSVAVAAAVSYVLFSLVPSALRRIQYCLKPVLIVIVIVVVTKTSSTVAGVECAGLLLNHTRYFDLP